MSSRSTAVGRSARTRDYLSAQLASARLGVAKATLYAYVSRGMVRSRAVQGSRAREYSVEDVEALLRRRAARQDPAAAAVGSLGVHGMPVLASSLSLIEAGALFYRGKPVLELAHTSTLEDVASLLWQRPFGDEVPLQPTASLRPRLGSLPIIARFSTYLADAGVRDVSARHLARPAVAKAGARILRGLAALATGGEPATGSIAGLLATGWGLSKDTRRLLEAALILCADHELNVSAFTARCIASAEAGPYLVVGGALAALAGRRHGNYTERVAELIDTSGSPMRVLKQQLLRGEEVPGFGHPLYPDGDPRGAALIELAPRGPVKRRVLGFVAAAQDTLGAHPTLDVGLLALCRSLGLPPDAPLAVFALGRVVGWIAHAMEQYEAGALIRPRARYVGPRPA